MENLTGRGPYTQHKRRTSRGLELQVISDNYDRSVSNICRFAAILKKDFPFLTDDDIEIVLGDPLCQKQQLVVETIIKNSKL